VEVWSAPSRRTLRWLRRQSHARRLEQQQEHDATRCRPRACGAREAPLRPAPSLITTRDGHQGARESVTSVPRVTSPSEHRHISPDTARPRFIHKHLANLRAMGVELCLGRLASRARSCFLGPLAGDATQGELHVGVLDRQTYQGGTRGSRLCGGDRDRETENSKVCARTRDTRFIQVRVAKVASPTSCLGNKYGALRLVLGCPRRDWGCAARYPTLLYIVQGAGS
jgi:hypothetical protein